MIGLESVHTWRLATTNHFHRKLQTVCAPCMSVCTNTFRYFDLMIWFHNIIFIRKMTPWLLSLHKIWIIQQHIILRWTRTIFTFREICPRSGPRMGPCFGPCRWSPHPGTFRRRLLSWTYGWWTLPLTRSIPVRGSEHSRTGSSVTNITLSYDQQRKVGLPSLKIAGMTAERCLT